MNVHQTRAASGPCDAMYTYGTLGYPARAEAACGLEMMRNGHGEFGGISGDTLSWEGVCRHYYIIFEINLQTPVRMRERRGAVIYLKNRSGHSNLICFYQRRHRYKD